MARFTIDKKLTIQEVLDKYGDMVTGKGKRVIRCLPFLILDKGTEELIVADPSEFSKEEIMAMYEMQLRTVPKGDKNQMLNNLGFLNDKVVKRVKITESKSEAQEGKKRLYVYSVKLDKKINAKSVLLIKNLKNNDLVSFTVMGDGSFAVTNFVLSEKVFTPEDEALIITEA